MSALKVAERVAAIVGTIFSVVMIAIVAKAAMDELRGEGPDPDDYYGQPSGWSEV